MGTLKARVITMPALKSLQIRSCVVWLKHLLLTQVRAPNLEDLFANVVDPEGSEPSWTGPRKRGLLAEFLDSVIPTALRIEVTLGHTFIDLEIHLPSTKEVQLELMFPVQRAGAEWAVEKLQRGGAGAPAGTVHLEFSVMFEWEPRVLAAVGQLKDLAWIHVEYRCGGDASDLLTFLSTPARAADGKRQWPFPGLRHLWLDGESCSPQNVLQMLRRRHGLGPKKGDPSPDPIPRLEWNEIDPPIGRVFDEIRALIGLSNFSWKPEEERPRDWEPTNSEVGEFDNHYDDYEYGECTDEMTSNESNEEDTDG